MLVPIDVASKTDMKGRSRLHRALMDFGPHLVHAQDRRSALLSASFLGLRVPVVATYHGVPERTPGAWAAGVPGAQRPPLRDLVVMAADAVVARRVDLTVAPSEAMAELVRRRLHVPADRVKVIANGVPVHPAVSLPELPSTVVFVGALVPRKGVDVLLDAFAVVHAGHPHLRLVVVGDGPERSSLERRAVDLGIASTVTFRGYRTDVPRELARAEVFVLPSRNENQPLALLEAMGAGLACIATDVGGTADVMPPDAGILVAADDLRSLSEALRTLVTKPGLAAAMGVEASRRVRARHSIAGCADEHLVVYDRALSRLG